MYCEPTQRESQVLSTRSCCRRRVELFFLFFLWLTLTLACCARSVLRTRRHVSAVVRRRVCLRVRVCAAPCVCVLLVRFDRRCVRGSDTATRTRRQVVDTTVNSSIPPTDDIFLCPANGRLLLARRCFGSSDERGRRPRAQPNVNGTWLLAVVGLQDKEFQLQH